MRLSKYSLIIALIYMMTNSCKSLDKLPEIEILSIPNGEIFSTESISKGNPFVIYYFDPDCSYCQDMTADIIKNIEKFKSFDFYYVSDQSDDKLTIFHRYFDLKEYPNIKIYKDYKADMKQFLQPNAIPYLSVFNKGKELEVIYSGGTDYENLIAELLSLNQNQP